MSNNKKFKLTKSQSELIDQITDWYEEGADEDFVYTGAAGTGKTTVIPYVIEKLGLSQDQVLYAAYTGKATSVLMQKGFPATTIHSAFFDRIEVPLRDERGRVVRKAGRELTTFKFEPKKYLSSRIQLIYLDEWSMINKEFMDVIYSFGIPVIASGDKYQLKPIFGESPFAKKVKYELTEITRQGRDSGIITLATMIRKGQELPRYMNFNNDAHIMSKEYLKDRHLLEADIILTPKNKTRSMFNDKVRRLKGSGGKLPNVGDKMICRKNVWNQSIRGIPLVNGILGTVTAPIIKSECRLSEGYYRIDFQPDYCYGTADEYTALLCDYEWLSRPLGSTNPVNIYNEGAKMEFGEAITVHLSQGSQYGKVVYWDEWMKDKAMQNQLRYTAVTRATDHVWMFID